MKDFKVIFQITRYERLNFYVLRNIVLNLCVLNYITPVLRSKRSLTVVSLTVVESCRASVGSTSPTSLNCDFKPSGLPLFAIKAFGSLLGVLPLKTHGTHTPLCILRFTLIYECSIFTL